NGRVGAPARLRPDLAQLRAVRRAARAGGRPLEPPEARAPRAARAQGTLPARQPPALQPQVLPELGAAVRRLRAAARPAARRDRGARGRGVPPAVRERAAVSAAGLLLALGSAAALNWGFVTQHGAAASLPPL